MAGVAGTPWVGWPCQGAARDAAAGVVRRSHVGGIQDAAAGVVRRSRAGALRSTGTTAGYKQVIPKFGLGVGQPHALDGLGS
jgi:hypothetical protein